MSKKPILIVDDENLVAEVLSIYLEDSFPDQFDFIFANSGKEAINIYQKNQLIECIFTDLHMNDGNGIFVLTEIKKINPKTKVILVSGDDKKYPNFDYILQKPFDINELKKIL